MGVGSRAGYGVESVPDRSSPFVAVELETRQSGRGRRGGRGVRGALALGATTTELGCVIASSVRTQDRDDRFVIGMLGADLGPLLEKGTHPGVSVDLDW